MTAVIPPKSNRVHPQHCDFCAYKENAILLNAFSAKSNITDVSFLGLKRKLKITWDLFDLYPL